MIVASEQRSATYHCITRKISLYDFNCKLYDEVLPVYRTIDSSKNSTQLNKMSSTKKAQNWSFMRVVHYDVFNHPIEIIESWMRCFASSLKIIELGAIHLLLVLVTTKSLER